MLSATVTIGRNVGTEPLPAGRWQRFVAETRHAVATATRGVLWVDHASHGRWDGVTECSHAFAGPVANTAAVQRLRARLVELAERYGQEAVGLVVGEAELVTA